MSNFNDPNKNKNDPQKNVDHEIQIQQAIQTCADWWIKDTQAKSPYNQELDEMYKLFKSDHWSLLDDSGHPLRTDTQKHNHPNAVENMVFSLVEGLVAEFSEQKELVDYPTEKDDEDTATTMTEIKQFIAYKNRLDDELVKWLRWFFLYGTGIWEVNWDADWQGGKGPNKWQGDVRWKARHPRSIVPDARCHDSIQDGRRLHDATYWTIEDVEEVFPDAKDIPPDSLSSDLIVGDDLEESTAENAEDQVLVVITWYKGSPLILDKGEKDEGPGLHYICWAGEGTRRYLKHGNYIYFEPGEDAQFPFIARKCYDRENSPWGYGEAYFLKNPQMIMNKTSEMIIEGHLHYAMGQTWYDESALTPKQQRDVEEKGTMAGMWFPVSDVNGIHREYGKGVPASLENEVSRLSKTMESIVGRFDISQGKTPSNITAFRALDLLASRAQVRLRSKEMALNTSFEECGNYINRIIQENYTENRRYRILGKDDNKPQYGIFEADSMKKAYIPAYDKSISMSELQALTQGQESLPEEDQMVEGKDYEIYSPEFDTKCKITTTMPTDRVFYMDMAKELLTSNVIDAETFFYVMEHGKFQPFEQMMEKIQQQQAAQAQQAQVQPTDPNNPNGGGQQTQATQSQMPDEQAQQIQQFIAYLKQKAPDILQEVGKLPQEQQLPAIVKMMEVVNQQAQGQPQQTQQEQPQEQQTGQTANAETVPQDDATRIKQELVAIMQAQQ